MLPTCPLHSLNDCSMAKSMFSGLQCITVELWDVLCDLALRSALTAHVACGGCYSSGVDSCGMGGSKICKTLCRHSAGAWVLTIDSKICAQKHHCSVVHTLECIPLCDFCPITSSVPPSLPSFLSYSLPLSLPPGVRMMWLSSN